MERKEVTINLENGYNEYRYEEYIFFDGISRKVNITTQKEDSIEDCLNDEGTFKAAVKIYNEDLDRYNEENDDEYPKSTITYDDFFNGNYDLTVRGTAEDLVYFLNKSNIKDKNILLADAETYTVDIRNEEFINKLIEGLDNIDNLYVLGDGNDKKVSLLEYKQTMEYMDNLVSNIQKLNLSPYEQLMYLYDIVRDRFYTEESEEEEYTKSRDLTEVTRGDKIVCVGFSQIFDKAAKKLGFNTHLIDLDTKVYGKHGHFRNMVYIYDEKYKINGIYTFDTTYDSKKKDNEHLNSYRFFAQPNVFFHGKETNRFANRETDDLVNAFLKIRNNEEVTFKELASINELSRKLLNRELFRPLEIIIFSDKIDENHFLYSMKSSIDKEQIYDKISKFYRMFSRKIPVNAFMNALVKVRSLEHYIDPEKYPLSEEKILEIVENSVDTSITAEEQLLTSIFGEPSKNPKKIMQNDKLDKEIAGVHLAKTLRKVLEKKNNE